MFFVGSLQSSQEILSQDCNLFRIRVRGHKQFFRALVSVYILLMGAVLASAWMFEALQRGLLGSFLLSCLYFYLSNRIYEERLLVIKGLGVQISSITAAGHERTTFLPLEQVASAYIFEAFNAFQTRHYFCVRSVEERNYLVFENLKPSVDFLKRVLQHLNEIKP